MLFLPVAGDSSVGGAKSMNGPQIMYLPLYIVSAVGSVNSVPNVLLVASFLIFKLLLF